MRLLVQGPYGTVRVVGVAQLGGLVHDRHGVPLLLEDGGAVCGLLAAPVVDEWTEGRTRVRKAVVMLAVGFYSLQMGLEIEVSIHVE